MLKMSLNLECHSIQTVRSARWHAASAREREQRDPNLPPQASDRPTGVPSTIRARNVHLRQARKAGNRGEALNALAERFDLVARRLEFRGDAGGGRKAQHSIRSKQAARVVESRTEVDPKHCNATDRSSPRQTVPQWAGLKSPLP